MSLQPIDDDDALGDIELPESEPPKSQKAKKQPLAHQKAQKAPRSLAHPVQGRGKGSKGLGRGGAARHRSMVRNGLTGVTKPAIKRLARRGGTKRISSDVYTEARGTLNEWMTRVLHDATIYTEHAKKKTIGVKQVVAALRNNGKILYGFKEK